MNRLFLKIYDFLSGRKWLAVIILAVLLGLSALMALNLHYDEDISAFLPQDEQSRKYTEVYKRLGGSDKVAVLFRLKEGMKADAPAAPPETGADGNEPESRAGDSAEDAAERIIEAMDAFGEKWAECDTAMTVSDMQTSVDGGAVFDVMDFIRANHPYYLDEEDYRRMDSLLADPGYIEKTIAADRDALLFPGSSFTAANLRYDPLRLFNGNFAALQSLNPSENSNIIDSHLFTSDGNTGIVFFTSPYGESETGQNSGLVKMLDSAISLTVDEFPDVEITATGGPVIAVGNSQRIKTDSIIAVSAALLLIFGLLFLQFRNLKDILWIGLSILCGTLFSLAFISFFKSSISIIILGIGSVIIGIAVNYPLHYIDYLKYESDTRKALRAVISPLVAGNVTTVFAFLSLQLIQTSALKDFGLVGAMMLVGTILFSVIFLPVLMPNHRSRSAKALKFNFGSSLNDRTYNRMFLPFLLVTLLLAFLGRNTGFDPDMHSINYMKPAQAEGLEILASMNGESDGGVTVYAVTEADDMETLLQHNEALTDSIRLQSGDCRISGISAILPSKALQEKRLRMWREFWTEHSGIAAEVEKAAVRHGFTATAFAPFIESLDAGFEPRDADYFAPVTDVLGQSFLIDGPDGGTAAVNLVRLPQGETLEDSDIDGTFHFSAADVSNSLSMLLSEEFDTIGLICSIIVFVFLWVSFGRLEVTLIAFLPLAVSWLWIGGLMSVFGISFNIVNVILATFIFGQGDDYTIFITEGLMHEYGTGKKILDSYRSSVAFSALIMFIGVGVLAFAKHPALKSLGQVTIIGMFTVVLLAYYLPPLVFNLLTKKNGRPREYPVTFRRILETVSGMLFFLLAIIFIIPGTRLYFLFDKPSRLRKRGAPGRPLTPREERRHLRYHIFLQKLSGFIITHIPGTHFSWKNAGGEDFSRPAVIICNHQSHFDVMMLMMLNPKTVILTNGWAWNNIFYKTIIRAAEFYPAADVMSENVDSLRDLVRRGYSIVVFPEGTRSLDCSIRRFHPGAFALAEKLGLDILPVVLHGFGKVLPKNELLSRGGEMYAEVLPRVTLQEMGADLRERTRAFRQLYVENYARISRERETAEYFVPYIKLKYAYKGADVEKNVKLMLKDLSWTRNLPADSVKCTITNCGAGAGALALALSRPELEVYASEPDEDLFAVAKACAGIPENLHFVEAGQ